MQVYILKEILDYLDGNGLVITDEELLDKAIKDITIDNEVSW